jgi:DnaJ-class molecular chaperone
MIYINLAYEVLGNAEKRSLYDRLNRDLFRKDKVIANFKKLTDKYKLILWLEIPEKVKI